MLRIIYSKVSKHLESDQTETFKTLISDLIDANRPYNKVHSTIGIINKLPSIEEAWTLPIPAELTQRQTARSAQKRNLNEPTTEKEKIEPPKWLMNELESNVLRHLQTNCQSLTSHQQAELERLEYGFMVTDFYKKLVKKRQESEKCKEEIFIKPSSERHVDYGMELSSIKGRRVPGICAPTEFSHIVTATELIK